MKPSIRFFFDHLSDGLLVLSGLGVVRYANPASQTVLASQLGEIIPFDTLRQSIDALALGRLPSPQCLSFDLGAPGSPRCVATTLMKSPVADEYLLILHPDDAGRHEHNRLANFVEMLDSSLEGPTQRLIAAAERMLQSFAGQAGSDLVLTREVSELGRRADELRNEIQQISLYAASCSALTLLGDDRIEIAQWLAEALAAARSTLVQRGIRLCFAGINDNLPVIYGSKHFLTRALAVYLKHLAGHLEYNSYMQVSVERRGAAIQLALIDYGTQGPAFPTIISESPTAGPSPDAAHTLDLSLPICKRIMELHRGRLLVINESERLHKIVFELPTGLPPTSDSELGMRQALRYAHDLRCLLKQQETSPGKGASVPSQGNPSIPLGAQPA